MQQLRAEKKSEHTIRAYGVAARGFAATRLALGERFGSDHYPYIARLCRVEPGRSDPPGTADPKLVEQARSVIQRARRQADKEGTDVDAG